jgi:hypothetical protein
MASKVVEVSLDPEAFLRDMLTSVCFFVQDGLSYSFAHRSFQEYYSAVFLVRASRETRAGLWDLVSRRADQDAVLHLVHEMNRELVEEELLAPKLEELWNLLSPHKGDRTKMIIKYLELCSEMVEISKDTANFAMTDERRIVGTLVNFVAKHYPTEIAKQCELTARQLTHKQDADYEPYLAGVAVRQIKASEYESVRPLFERLVPRFPHLQCRVEQALALRDTLRACATKRKDMLAQLLAD